MTETNPSQSPQWQSTIETLLAENIKENRRRRRWSIFFKSFFTLYILFLTLLILLPGIRLGAKLTAPHASMVDIDGAIMPDAANSADNVVKGLNRAFADPHAQGVILRINSPGGSPVQTADIYNAITRLRERYPHKKIYAVCSDLCASAAYYVASATNDIYANPSSLVGSIGVLLNSFGFTGTLDKLGIERRLITAGAEKGFLDPFSPLKPQDKAYAQALLNDVQQQFIHAVEQGRGNRLHITANLFSGLIWTGSQAKQLGLVDGFGNVGYVARNILKTSTIIDYTHKQSFFERVSRGVGASFAQGILATLQGNLFS